MSCLLHALVGEGPPTWGNLLDKVLTAAGVELSSCLGYAELSLDVEHLISPLPVAESASLLVQDSTGNKVFAGRQSTFPDRQIVPTKSPVLRSTISPQSGRSRRFKVQESENRQSATHRFDLFDVFCRPEFCFDRLLYSEIHSSFLVFRRHPKQTPGHQIPTFTADCISGWPVGCGNGRLLA